MLMGRTVRTITSQIAKSQRSLALNLQTRAVHKLNKARDEFGLRLRQLLPVVSYDQLVSGVVR